MKFPEHQVHYTHCDCGEMMHQAKFEYWDDECHDVELSVMMPQERPWYKRIIPALRYMLNLRGVNDWHYTSIVLQKEEVQVLQDFLSQFQTDRDAYWDHKEGKKDSYTPSRKFSVNGQGF